MKLRRSFFIDMDKIVFCFSILYILVLGEAYFKSDSTAIVIYILHRGKRSIGDALLGGYRIVSRTRPRRSILPSQRSSRKKWNISWIILQLSSRKKRRKREFWENNKERDISMEYKIFNIFFFNHNYIGNSKTKQLHMVYNISWWILLIKKKKEKILNTS